MNDAEKYLHCPICLNGNSRPQFREQGLEYHLSEFHRRVDVADLIKLAKKLKQEATK